MWAVACHPLNQYFATVGADRRVRVWTSSAQVAVSAQFQYELFSIDWSSDGKLILVGDANGTIHVLNALGEN
jgi:WD40 repeat protein